MRLSEEQSGTDKGLMGIPLASSVKKPSDGQPFKNLSVAAGQTPRGPAAGGPAGMAPGGLKMMRKKMKKS